MMHVLFVCTGNTCRSPLAEYLLRSKAGEQLEVKSAGVAAYSGDQASSHVIKLLEEKGVAAKHSSQSVTDELMHWADLILTMTTSHKLRLLQQFPYKADHIFTLKEYVDPSGSSLDISDPFGGDLEVYRSTLQELEQLLEPLLEKLHHEQDSST